MTEHILDTERTLNNEIKLAQSLINSVKGLLDPQFQREPEVVEFANNLIAKLEEQNQDRKNQLQSMRNPA